MKSERLTGVDGFGTLDRRVYMTPIVRHNVYSCRHSIYSVPYVSPYVKVPFIPPLCSLCSRVYVYMYVYTFAKKTIISQARLGKWRRALCRGRSLSPRSSNLRNHFVSTDPLLACGDLHGPHIRWTRIKHEKYMPACISRVGNVWAKKRRIL